MATLSAIRLIHNVPIYHMPPMYPSSPIAAFPPAAPSAGRPLAERVGQTLRIKTNFGASDHTVRSPGKHTQPHRIHLPRRRNPKRLRSFQSHSVPVEKEDGLLKENPLVYEKAPIEINEKAEPLASVEVSATRMVSPEIHPPRLAEWLIGVCAEDSDHLQELIPGLYLALSDADPSAEQPKLLTGQPWTHVVNITYPAESESHNGISEQSYGAGIQRLHLVLPSSTRAQMQSTARNGLGLTDAHLRTARDFIAQALPTHIASLPDQADVRVLITAPHGRPTDVMCAASCYLSYASGRGVDEVLRFVDEEIEFLSIWKGEVSDDECERTQKIARSWSWLSLVKSQ